MGNVRELYIVQLLSQSSEGLNAEVVWRRTGNLFSANFNESGTKVVVEVGTVTSRPMSRVVINFTSDGLGKVSIYEPIPEFSLRGIKYGTSDEKELVDAMKGFLEIARSQCAQREKRDLETEEERKQAIFNRLISGA